MPLANLKDITFRNYKEGDEREIVDLHNSVFKGKYSLAQWNWEHKMNPFSHISIVLAMYDSKIVGQSLSIPLSYFHEGELVRTTRVQNVMVHPDFRKQGVFLHTLKNLTNQVYEKQIEFIYTFPNDRSIGAFVKRLDYHHIFDIFTYNLSVSLISEYNSRDIRCEFDKKFNFVWKDIEFINSQLSSFAIFNNRDIEYMNSSTITPIIKILERAKRSKVGVTVEYLAQLKWQDLIFSALEIFQTKDQRILIHGNKQNEAI